MESSRDYPRLVLRRLRSYGRSVTSRHRGYGEPATRRYRYHQNKRRHLRLYEPDAGRAPDRDVLTTIAKDGVAVIREFLPADVAKQIEAEVRPSLEALAANRYEGPLRTMIEEEPGLYRLYGIEESLSPSSRAFFDNAFLADLANSMCRPGMHIRDRYVDYKAKSGGRDKNVDYHIDHWKLRFKAFFLLEDVTEDQAPFVYLTGSHREQRWRRGLDWGYQHRGEEASILRPDEARKICMRYGLEERTYTGKAGDLIIADTRGIHRGNVLKTGTRLQLVQLYVMNGAEEYAC